MKITPAGTLLGCLRSVVAAKDASKPFGRARGQALLAGLVSRGPHTPQHGAAYLLTPRGRAALELLAPFHREVDQRLLALLTPAQADLLELLATGEAAPRRAAVSYEALRQKGLARQGLITSEGQHMRLIVAHGLGRTWRLPSDDDTPDPLPHERDRVLLYLRETGLLSGGSDVAMLP